MQTKIIVIWFFFLVFTFSKFSINAQEIPVKEKNSIRLMSYNINDVHGLDDKVDYQRIADVINNVRPDVIALQEIDSVDLLSRKTLMHPTYATSIDYDRGRHGVGVLSKEKPLSVKKIPLAGKGEDRILLIVEFELYYFGNVYFSLNEEDRVKSVEIIKNEAEKLLNQDKPFFLAGDMNDIPESKSQKEMNNFFTSLIPTKQFTFPADNPTKCIDYIYAYNEVGGWSLLTNRGVITEKEASNHRPIYADIRIHAEEDNIFRTKPYLQNPTGNGITISWLTNVPVHSWVEYGIDGNLDQTLQLYVDGQMNINNYHHKFRLENLKPGVKYSYRVYSKEMTVYEGYRKEFGKTAISDTYTFKIPSENSSDFTAVIFNDLHQRRNLIDLFTDLIADIDYDFVFFNGDNISDPRDEAQAVSALSYMNEMVNASSVPVFYIRGNHEIRNAYSIGLRDLLDYVDDKTYGAFNWGDTRFVMLDCGEDKDDSSPVYYGLNDFSGLRKDQAEFLKEEVISSDFKSASKRVLIHHIPVYGLNEDAYNPSLEMWGDILKYAQFDVSLHGHTHRFAYHPVGSLENNFPVVVGGGNNPESGTLMVLEKKGDKMTLKVLDTNAKELLKLDF